MAITYEPRLGLPQWNAGADPFLRAQVDDAFAKIGNLGGRGEQGPLSQLPPPAAPTTATAAVGGTLAPATYAYRITALSPASGSFAAGETTPSAEVAQVVPAGTATNTVTVNWVAVPGATGYRIYGRAAGVELLLATVGAVNTWTDTGATIPAGAMPATNTTAGRPAPGIRNRTYWATDDRTGRYSYDDGAAWHDLGPSPVTGPQAGSTALIVGHAAAATSDAVLVARGKTGQTGDLLKLQDPTATTDLVRVSSSGALFAQAGATITPATAAAVPVTVKGLTSQTGDLLKVQDPTGATDLVRVSSSGALFAQASATVRPASTGAVGLIVNGLTGQTADLQQWQANGAIKAQLDVTGRLAATGGIDVTGSPTGYDGEVRFTSAAAAPNLSISTLFTGAGQVNFDHRGAGNTGFWQWRNGTGAASTRMVLDGTGNLNPAGNLTVGTTAAGSAQISLAGGSVSGRIAYQDTTNLYLGAMDVARPLILRSMGVDALTLDNQAGHTLATFAGGASVNALLYATLAGVGKFEVDPNGGIQGAGDNHYFGRGAFAVTGVRFKLSAGVAATLRAEDQAAGAVPLSLQGTSYSFQDGSGTAYLGLNNPGSGSTALFVRSNSPTTGVNNSAAVTLGAVDSGGAGFRLLRVPN